MKVLLYTENQKVIGKSGLGKAIKHQIKALENEGINYTLNIMMIMTFFILTLIF